MSSPEAPTLIVAVYGTYAAWLGPFLESALATGHRDFLIVSDAAERPSAEALAHWAFEGSHVEATEVAEDPDFQAMLAEPKLRHLAYLAAWRRAYRLLRPLQRFACCHVDTLLERNLATCWTAAKPTPFGLAAPTRRVAGRWVFDPVLLCGTAAPSIESEMSAFVREATRLSTSPERERVFQNYGSFETAALAMLHARSEEGTGTIYGQLPVDCVVHFQGTVPAPDTALGRRWRQLAEEYEARKEGVTS